MEKLVDVEYDTYRLTVGELLSGLGIDTARALDLRLTPHSGTTGLRATVDLRVTRAGRPE